MARDLYYDEIRRRYETDPVFHQFVDSMYCAIDSLCLAPSELRQAAMLAAVMWQERHGSLAAIEMELERATKGARR